VRGLRHRHGAAAGAPPPAAFRQAAPEADEAELTQWWRHFADPVLEEIVAKGGVLAYQTKEEYVKWFSTLTPQVRDRVCEAWGNPPGEERDGIPAAMLYQGKIVITGVQYGNAVVCVQPKRGCAGARCDGQVCKILHDPDVPPTHQYMATYRYLEEAFGADVLIHVGTHGSLEFLPGKGWACPGTATLTSP